MRQENRALLATAVDALIGDIDAQPMYLQMLGIIEMVERGFPVQLTGRPAVLNPLVDLHATDPDAFDRVVDLINRKRGEANNDPLHGPNKDDDSDRKVYMRDFMAKKREKQATLVHLWNELRSEHDKIKGVRRMEFEREHAARWQDEKKRREDALRVRLNRRLSEAERKAIANQLWEDVQTELDRLEEFVRSEVRKPVHQRAPGGFNFTVGVIKKG